MDDANLYFTLDDSKKDRIRQMGEHCDDQGHEEDIDDGEETTMCYTRDRNGRYILANAADRWFQGLGVKPRGKGKSEGKGFTGKGFVCGKDGHRGSYFRSAHHADGHKLTETKKKRVLRSPAERAEASQVPTSEIWVKKTPRRTPRTATSVISRQSPKSHV